MLLLLVSSAGLTAGCDERAPTGSPSAARTTPPPVELSGADPAVVQAVRQAREKVIESPRAASAWGDLGMVLLAHDVFAEATTCFAEAARYAPADPRWPYLQALALLEGNPDPTSALPALETAADLSTDEPAPRLKLGEVLLEQGRVDEAEAQFEAALALDAGNARAELGLGRVAYLRGELKAAKAHLERAARAAPRVKATHALLAELQFRDGDRAGADASRRAMQRLSDTYHWPDPYFAQVLERWVGALARIERANDLFVRGRHAEAIELMQTTVRLHPRALLAHLVLGRFLLQSNRLADAESALRQAVTLAPEAFEAQHELGTVLARLGRTTEAMACFEETVRIKPGYAPAHYQLARCRLQLNDTSGALKALIAAVRFRPDDAAAQRALGHLLAQNGRFGEAAEHLRHAVRLQPSDETAKRLLEEVRRRIE